MSLLLLFPESLPPRVSSIGSASSSFLEPVSSLNLTISLLSSRSLCSSNCLARWSCSSACFNCCLTYQSLSSFPTLFLFSSYFKSSDWNLSKLSVYGLLSIKSTVAMFTVSTWDSGALYSSVTFLSLSLFLDFIFGSSCGPCWNCMSLFVSRRPTL